MKSGPKWAAFDVRSPPKMVNSGDPSGNNVAIPSTGAGTNRRGSAART